MALRQVFLERVRSRLYIYLRDGYLKGWDVPQIYDFAQAVIHENSAEIDKYLLDNKVTLENINASIEDLIKKVLIPSIKV